MDEWAFIGGKSGDLHPKGQLGKESMIEQFGFENRKPGNWFRNSRIRLLREIPTKRSDFCEFSGLGTEHSHEHEGRFQDQLKGV